MIKTVKKAINTSKLQQRIATSHIACNLVIQFLVEYVVAGAFSPHVTYAFICLLQNCFKTTAL